MSANPVPPCIFYDEIPLPDGYEPISWEAVKPGDEVWLKGLRLDDAKVNWPAALGPYEVLGLHRLLDCRPGFFVPLKEVREYSDRLLRKTTNIEE